MKFTCPNHSEGCQVQGTKQEIIAHLQEGKGCPFSTAVITDKYRHGDLEYFDSLLSDYELDEPGDTTATVPDTLPVSTFEGGGGGESGGAGATGSWEPSDSPQPDSDDDNASSESPDSSASSGNSDSNTADDGAAASETTSGE